MTDDKLEHLLGRAAKLVDEDKRSDLISRLPYEQMPPKKVRELTKGELLAEVLHFEVRGFVRDKIAWYPFEDNTDD